MAEGFRYVTSDDITHQLVNLRQITFEVTDACNLKCKYCGYGEFYSDYDKRENNNLPVEKAVALLDYLGELWESDMNDSVVRNVYISFYGGEPLLNMEFVKQIIAYTQNMNIPNRRFMYSMTTNAVLLDKYVDFLATNEFRLLISLDGDKDGNGYRVDSRGNDHFDKIIDNINMMRERYSDYFDKYVNFNSVLHNKNSYESIYTFIKEQFGKVTTISPLNNSGIRDEMKDVFMETYRNPYMSLLQSEHYDKIERNMFMKSGNYHNLTMFIHQYSDFVFHDYRELLYGNSDANVVPTGTCIPFSKKIFVTVNGKLLPCERIGQHFSMGQIPGNNQVILDTEEIAMKHNSYLRRITKQCTSCKIKKSCIQCVYNLEDIECDSVECHGYTNEFEFEQYVASQMAFLESHPEDYYKIMEEVIIE